MDFHKLYLYLIDYLNKEKLKLIHEVDNNNGLFRQLFFI
jgi:hypothetical protein